MTERNWVNAQESQMHAVESNPLNNGPTEWYTSHDDSTLPASLQGNRQNTDRNIAAYMQKQQRYAQPNTDSKDMWAQIYGVLANNVYHVWETIAHQGPEQHNATVMRPGLVYSDPQAEQQSNAYQQALGVRK